MRRKAMGRWSALFNGRSTFEEEIGLAIEIGSEWGRTDYQRDIVLDEIPGWLSPLWGSDDDWLYIRRPEGLWKTRLAQGFEDDTPLLLYQKRSAPSGTRTIGCLSIGCQFKATGGWHVGRPALSSIGAFELDDKRDPSQLGVGIAADAIGQDLWEQLPFEGDGLLVRAGEDFCVAPIFSRSGDWLVAREETSGWRVAYPIERGSEVHEALESGNLWLRYRGPWLRTLDVKVAVTAAPT